VDFFSYILDLDVFFRIITTAVIVIIVTTSVGTFGPVVGGLLAGLPIALGPGFYFLINKVSIDFLAQTATFSLLALSATQAFLLTYIMTARYGFQIISLATSISVWVLFLAGSKQLPITILSASLLFACMTCGTYLIGSRFVTSKSQVRKKDGFWILVFRACMGGVIVAIVTITAPLLGGEYTGMLLAFPIFYALLSITIHKQYGTATVIHVLHSALLGTVGLAIFCATFAVFLQSITAISAFFIGLVTSLAATGCMMLGATIKPK
jgi:hypothetical protein